MFCRFVFFIVLACIVQTQLLCGSSDLSSDTMKEQPQASSSSAPFVEPAQPDPLVINASLLDGRYLLSLFQPNSQENFVIHYMAPDNDQSTVFAQLTVCDEKAILTVNTEFPVHLVGEESFGNLTSVHVKHAQDIHLEGIFPQLSQLHTKKKLIIPGNVRAGNMSLQADQFANKALLTAKQLEVTARRIANMQKATCRVQEAHFLNFISFRNSGHFLVQRHGVFQGRKLENTIMGQMFAGQSFRLLVQNIELLGRLTVPLLNIGGAILSEEERQDLGLQASDCVVNKLHFGESSSIKAQILQAAAQQAITLDPRADVSAFNIIKLEAAETLNTRGIVRNDPNLFVYFPWYIYYINTTDSEAERQEKATQYRDGSLEKIQGPKINLFKNHNLIHLKGEKEATVGGTVKGQHIVIESGNLEKLDGLKIEASISVEYK